MKLGFVSAILDGWSFEEMIDTARDLGFSCVEAACWPSGKAERRYAGVSHIDVDGLTDEKAAYILGYCKERGVELSSLAFYPNTMDEDLEKRAANIAHLKKVILASEKLGVGMVTTFVGRATHKTVEENLELFREIWPPIVAFAEEHGIALDKRDVEQEEPYQELLALGGDADLIPYLAYDGELINGDEAVIAYLTERFL